MTKPKLTRLRQDQGGFILIEIVVSAAMLAIVAAGVFIAFDVGERSTAEERHRARAHSLAQADVERMQSMRIAGLNGLNQSRAVTQDGLSYTIVSFAEFVTETATTSTCAAGTGSRDMLRVISTVTWPSIGTRPPVSISGVVSPPNGSVVPDTGSLLASVKDSRSLGVPGVAMTGSGAGSFSGTTGPGGCVMWRNLPAGNYSLNFGGAATGKVNEQGLAPSAQTVSVVAGSTNTVNYQFDTPGRILNIRFRTRDYSNALIDSTADSVVVNNTNMNTARTFAAPGGVRAASISTPSPASMFPFTSPYDPIFAGTCGDNLPIPTTVPAVGMATVPVGGTVAGPVLQLPSLLVTLWSGTGPGASTQGSRVSGGDVTVTEDNPDCPHTPRTLTINTDSQGQIPIAEAGNVGLPYSDDYEICANNSAKNDRRFVSNFALTSVGATGTALNIYLGGGPTGNCPS
jgi:type II secretory pathway pseudopilin PulG